MGLLTLIKIAGLARGETVGGESDVYVSFLPGLTTARKSICIGDGVCEARVVLGVGIQALLGFWWTWYNDELPTCQVEKYFEY